MICKNCGTPIPDGMSICQNCGTPAETESATSQNSPLMSEPEMRSEVIGDMNNIAPMDANNNVLFGGQPEPAPMEPVSPIAPVAQPNDMFGSEPISSPEIAPVSVNPVIENPVMEQTPEPNMDPIMSTDIITPVAPAEQIFDQPVNEPKPKKKNMTLIIIVIILILAVLAGGAYLLLGDGGLLNKNNTNENKNPNNEENNNETQATKDYDAKYGKTTFTVPNGYYYQSSNDLLYIISNDETKAITFSFVEGDYSTILAKLAMLEADLKASGIAITKAKEETYHSKKFIVLETELDGKKFISAYTTGTISGTVTMITLETTANTFDYDTFDIATAIAKSMKISTTTNFEVSSSLDKLINTLEQNAK